MGLAAHEKFLTVADELADRFGVTRAAGKRRLELWLPPYKRGGVRPLNPVRDCGWANRLDAFTLRELTRHSKAAASGGMHRTPQ